MQLGEETTLLWDMFSNLLLQQTRSLSQAFQSIHHYSFMKLLLHFGQHLTHVAIASVYLVLHIKQLYHPKRCCSIYMTMRFLMPTLATDKFYLRRIQCILPMLEAIYSSNKLWQTQLHKYINFALQLRTVMVIAFENCYGYC